MSDDNSEVTVRMKTSLRPEILGHSVMGIVAYIAVSIILVVGTFLGSILLGTPALAILAVVGVEVVGLLVVGAVLAVISSAAPEYTESTLAFVRMLLTQRYGQQTIRHDGFADRSYPDLESFANQSKPDADSDDANTERRREEKLT
jgi:hypothetical protein